MKRIILLLLLSTLFSCSIRKNKIELDFPEGGYSFAEYINPKDSSFLFYPIRSLETISDSTFDAFYTSKLYESFNEPNISLRPREKPLFRILYSQWTRPAYFITVTEDNIIIKKGLRVDYLHKVDTVLTEIEQLHLQILESGVPLSKRLKNKSPVQRKFIDSLIKLCPDLLKEEYYHKLMSKSFIPLDKPFTYSTRIISIGSNRFIKIMKIINNSGFWKLPIELDCKNPPNDGNSIIVECNTDNKYQVVKFGSCGDQPSDFKIACQEIIKYAGLSDEIKLLH